MCGDQHIARSRFQKRKTLLEIFKGVGIAPAVAEEESVRGNGSQAIRINHTVADGSFARLPCPTRAAGSMAGRQMHGDCDFANAKALAVVQFVDVLDRRNGACLAVLWIILRNAAVPHYRCTPMACEDSGATQPL